ncbi:MAG: hypothetical protein JO170_26420 [Verrucomicrobia bacterium]|nr:hypothetical protein [Verrucomicrobiota bacterium]
MSGSPNNIACAALSNHQSPNRVFLGWCLRIGPSGPNGEIADMTLNAFPIPELGSGTYGLAGLGLFGICWVLRRKKGDNLIVPVPRLLDKRPGAF